MIYDLGNNSYTKQDLEKLGIYDLRELGREVGVPSPTTMKKEQLIDYIVGIIHGQMPKNNASLRGRPAKTSQKSYQKFVDLIDKIEAPKVSNNFVSKDKNYYYDSGLSYSGTIASKVASFKEDYINDAKDDDVIIQKGVVCAEDNQFVVRKLRFVSSPSDAVLPLNLVNEYGLKDNDIIDYFLEEGERKVSQIIKINGNLAHKLDVLNMKNGISSPEESLNIDNNYSIKSKSSTMLIVSNSKDRAKTVDSVAKTFIDSGYSVCKVCFDRLKGSKDVSNNMQMTEYFPETVGDDFETIAMAESAIERAKFYTGLGCKTMIIFDNLGWLLNVVETYPVAIYGNFIEKIARMSVSLQMTVICVTGGVPEEKMNKLVNIFDYILNIDKFV